ncbi:cytochrome C oxidase subunit IV family protein [Thalassotalea psychrophila]|uniref:Cytochrome C oxidase subunit IV family protein n=1 Tax=Thalassotalea psychrophila TaxID=3065647 RepID=A0ABY9U0Z9_9GAMM|nr:cytochrome C oxidase subunit IV family protein [Colwelliaceae bacterium SQ149]
MNKFFVQNQIKTMFRDVLIWSLLVVFTLSSWWLGHTTQGLTADVITSMILLLSFLKIRLVILHFMEIKTASFILRLMFEVWCFGVCAILIFLFVY